MDTHLVVVRSYGDLAGGDVVVDATRIADILHSERARCVVRVDTPASKGA
jgi:hypothetical protein